ncbi:hypothetical protein PGT21_000001, partial [Puccinia graminis f. sp. tritici]
MGTNQIGCHVALTRIFKVREDAATSPQVRCSSRAAPYLPARGFQGVTLTSFKGPIGTVPCWVPGIGTGFPFARRRDRLTRVQRLFTRNPSTTSVLQGLSGVFATTTRSAPSAAPGRLTPRPFCAHRRDPPTRQSFMAD